VLSRDARHGALEERCSAFSSGADIARQRGMTTGCGTIGWVQRDTGRQAWDAWLDRRTGEGRLRVLAEQGQ
jgi:hypothetical protein